MVFLHQGIQEFVSSVMSTMFSIAHVSQFVFFTLMAHGQNEAASI